VVVLFMPNGVIPAVTDLVKRIRGGGETSIREMTAEELLEHNRGLEAPAEADPPSGAHRSTETREVRA
jgi:branched-chain amino acid transport system permease protein